MTHRVDASPETCHWGYFDATRSPVLAVEPGETVVLETVSGPSRVVPQGGYHVPPALRAIHAAGEPQMPGHILTGPVAIRGAQPGDTLEVHIDAIELGQDWGYHGIRPLAGTLPDEFDTARLTILPLDAEAGVARMPWGLDLPLAPFFGVMGVAPPPHWGRISTIQPRMHAGNIDNRELVAGTTLFLPVFNDGALFSCGDGHAAQGDGEVTVNAIETALTGTFTFGLIKATGQRQPMAETPTHLITMGFDPDLDRCAEIALREMIALIVARTGLDREDAYMLCSLAGDLRITQTVNGNKGVHMMMAKALLGQG